MQSKARSKRPPRFQPRRRSRRGSKASFVALAPILFQSLIGVSGAALPADPIQSQPDYQHALDAFQALPPVRILFDSGAGGAPGSPLAGFEDSFTALPVPGTTAQSWYLGPAGTLSTRVSFSHRDKAYYTDDNQGYLNKVDRLDANFTWFPSRGPFTFSIYGTNLLNNVTYGGDTILPNVPIFGGVGHGLPTFSPLNKGRVYGAEVRAKF